MFMSEAWATVLPVQGTEAAKNYDHLFNFLVAMSAFWFVLVVGGMIYFAIAYKASPERKAKYIAHNVPLEVMWTAVPTLILMGLFAWGWKVYKNLNDLPMNAMEVKVIGKQWLWQYQYANGRTTLNDLYVPVNTPVKLVMTSEDVIHDYFVPAFRLKRDVVPGVYSQIGFEATAPGKHHVFCAAYCGASHSGMIGSLYVLTPDQWDAFQSGQKITSDEQGNIVVAAETAGSLKAKPLAEQGKELAQTKGCIACHSADGSKMVGPSWKGIFGSDRELHDGQKVKADENYLRESIVNSQAKVVKGFGPPSSMPPYQGLLNDQEMNAIIDYIKSLK